MQFLPVSWIIEFHKDVIIQFGGLYGIRDKGLLESALAYPQFLYLLGMERDKYILAASYCYHLIHNHPFVDGNKRIGALAMLHFLRLNGVTVHVSKEELYNFIMNITTSKMSEEEIAKILRSFPATFKKNNAPKGLA